MRRGRVGLRGLLIAVAVGVALAGCSDDTPPAGDEHPAWPKGLDCGFSEAVVDGVIDGDTIRVSVRCSHDSQCPDGASCSDEGLCTESQSVRLMGINAGEIPHHGGEDEEHQCLGDTAKAVVERLTLGQEVTLVFDPEAGCEGTYGRALAYVVVDDVLLQERLLEEGLVCLYWYSSEGERTLFYERLQAAQDRASAMELGIWSPNGEACDGLPVQPKCSE